MSTGNAGDRVSEKFGSVDPAPAANDTTDVSELAQRLQDKSVDLPDRFSALFALRNMRTDAADSALATALVTCNDSALLQHEIAYVLGQLQSGSTVSSLLHVLQDYSVDDMVRHEAAEALGSIGTEEAMSILKQHTNDPAYVVRSSIQIALDMAAYENNDQQFNFLTETGKQDSISV